MEVRAGRKKDAAAISASKISKVKPVVNGVANIEQYSEAKSTWLTALHVDNEAALKKNHAEAIAAAEEKHKERVRLRANMTGKSL